MKKKAKKKHIHDFGTEQCDFCGHVCEVCLKCWKGRCSEVKELTKPF